MEMPKLTESIRKITKCEEGQEWRAWEILTRQERKRIADEWQLETKRMDVRLAISEVAKQLRYFAERFDTYAADISASSPYKETNLALWALNLGLQITSNIKLDQLMHRTAELARMEAEVGK